MRRDMYKIIVERPRWHHPESSTRGRPLRDVEEAPTRQAMRRRYKERQLKAPGENLAPLRRYLLKQVGRPWNKVFSDICQHARVDSVVQNHVRLHIKDYVALDGSKHRLLYVDRRTGILRRTKRIQPAK
jgi:hypothetical protein